MRKATLTEYWGVRLGISIIINISLWVDDPARWPSLLSNPYCIVFVAEFMFVETF